jgi:hypothetical protein
MIISYGFSLLGLTGLIGMYVGDGRAGTFSLSLSTDEDVVVAETHFDQHSPMLSSGRWRRN